MPSLIAEADFQMHHDRPGEPELTFSEEAWLAYIDEINQWLGTQIREFWRANGHAPHFLLLDCKAFLASDLVCPNCDAEGPHTTAPQQIGSVEKLMYRCQSCDHQWHQATFNIGNGGHNGN